ncbi:dihydrofolate reductase family protein [Luteipulveratus mongoliensis]|uniref:Riboflavin biosynthesis protein RibD n=1 Tax=Luteipulveratus mongoliensis TaxID=571913 RepID=A0A0K1JN65_9MICO|nr:dihydrofolate reductase family protein [Luteipulveratus mongoliensis]AKU18146.1 riboflavin biosynthesis protein RibD [Luteipulveratus mongoliensis]
MRIMTRLCTSIDGYVTTPQGWPAQLADPDFSPETYGFVDFQQRVSAVLMGRATFEPALGSERWPWQDLGVFVLGSHRPEGTPDHVVVDSDPTRLLEQMRAAHPDGDVHLVGGPRTVETFRALGALDQLGLIVVPRLLGGGTQLTPAVQTDTGLKLSHHNALPNGAVELVYDIEKSA